MCLKKVRTDISLSLTCNYFHLGLYPTQKTSPDLFLLFQFFPPSRPPAQNQVPWKTTQHWVGWDVNEGKWKRSLFSFETEEVDKLATVEDSLCSLYVSWGKRCKLWVLCMQNEHQRNLKNMVFSNNIWFKIKNHFLDWQAYFATGKQEAASLIQLLDQVIEFKQGA